jgi:peptidoglycan/xylan/chitin deacetylase (PgdA/CDA1 family)
MFPARTPWIIERALPGFLWSMPRTGKELYLTFDDGPIPEVTPWVLDLLAEHRAKATFFCLGRNCATHPHLLKRIVREGHGVGNHTWDHPRGRRTGLTRYLRSVLRCQSITGTSLFRPPYGSLTIRQFRTLRRHFKIVMWDVLSGDYDPGIDGPTCLRRVLDHARPGSIIVFHDSLKAENNLRFTLPQVLSRFGDEGYRFRSLSEEAPTVPLA